ATTGYGWRAIALRSRIISIAKVSLVAPEILEHVVGSDRLGGTARVAGQLLQGQPRIDTILELHERFALAEQALAQEAAVGKAHGEVVELQDCLLILVAFKKRVGGEVLRGLRERRLRITMLHLGEVDDRGRIVARLHRIETLAINLGARVL